MDCGTRQNTNHHAHLNNDLLNFWGVTQKPTTANNITTSGMLKCIQVCIELFAYQIKKMLTFDL